MYWFMRCHNEISCFVLFSFLILWIIVFIFDSDWTMRWLFHKIACCNSVNFLFLNGNIYFIINHCVSTIGLLIPVLTVLLEFMFSFISSLIVQSWSTMIYFCKSGFHFATLIQGSLAKEGERVWIVSVQSLPMVPTWTFPSPLFPELTFLLFLYFSFSFHYIAYFLNVLSFQICKSSYWESEKMK